MVLYKYMNYSGMMITIGPAMHMSEAYREWYHSIVQITNGGHHVRYCWRHLTVTQWVPQVEQELLSIPVHSNFPRNFSGVRVDQSLFFSPVCCRPLLVLFPFSVWSLYLTSDYHFSIFTSLLIRIKANIQFLCDFFYHYN